MKLINKTMLIIKTEADEDYMPLILSRVAMALKRGYLCGEGTIIRPSDDEGYPYKFYYKK